MQLRADRCIRVEPNNDQQLGTEDELLDGLPAKKRERNPGIDCIITPSNASIMHMLD